MGINPGMGMYGMPAPGYVAPGVMPMAGPMPMGGPMPMVGPMAGPMPGAMPGVIPPSGQFGYGYAPRY